MPQLLNALIEKKGSDLHISVNSPPRLRINGDLVSLDLPILTDTQSAELCLSVLNEEQRAVFKKTHEIDFSFGIKGLCRFRGNVFIQRSRVSGVFRIIPTKIPTIADLELPAAIANLCNLSRGLVLVTGPTGSGKSTALAAMIDYINTNYAKHIVTIEDPIEFVHSHKNSLVNQRELGADTKSFQTALRACLRQDPDVILVGELRDLETISMALSAAETGHLVFATMHTNSSVATINRIIDVFPADQQAQIKTQLSFSLVGVMSQLLVRTVKGSRRACYEIMIPNGAIRNMIREDKVHQIYSAIQMGQENSGMVTMNQSLVSLVLSRQIALQTAEALSPDVSELMAIIEKSQGGLRTKK